MNEDSNEVMVDEEDAETLAAAGQSSTLQNENKFKKKKSKKDVFHSEWLKVVEYQQFLKEYKLDESQATCIACNQHFSIHYRGKTDIDNHMKTIKNQNNMKSFNVNQQLMTKTIKPSEENDVNKIIFLMNFSLFIVCAE